MHNLNHSKTIWRSSFFKPKRTLNIRRNSGSRLRKRIKGSSGHSCPLLILDSEQSAKWTSNLRNILEWASHWQRSWGNLNRKHFIMRDILMHWGNVLWICSCSSVWWTVFRSLCTGCGIFSITSGSRTRIVRPKWKKILSVEKRTYLSDAALIHSFFPVLFFPSL